MSEKMLAYRKKRMEEYFADKEYMKKMSYKLADW